jgi:hypothetical protein
MDSPEGIRVKDQKQGGFCVQTELRRAMTCKEEEMRKALEVERDLRQELLRQVSSSTDKKEKKIFLIYKKIQNGAVAKSFIRKGVLLYI